MTTVQSLINFLLPFKKAVTVFAANNYIKFKLMKTCNSEKIKTIYKPVFAVKLLLIAAELNLVVKKQM